VKASDRARSAVEAATISAVIVATGIYFHGHGGLEHRWIAAVALLISVILRHISAVLGYGSAARPTTSLLGLCALVALVDHEGTSSLVAAGAAACSALPFFDPDAAPAESPIPRERALVLLGALCGAGLIGFVAPGFLAATAIAPLALAGAALRPGLMRVAVVSLRTATLFVAATALLLTEVPAPLMIAGVVAATGLALGWPSTAEGQVHVAKTFFCGVVLAAVLYNAILTEYGAVTVPLWDEWDLAPKLVRAQEGTLAWSDLIALESENRPLTGRCFLLALARVTAWDMRAEFLLVTACLLTTLAVHARALRRLVAGRRSPLYHALVSLLALVLLSPGQNHIHWFSWTLHLQLAALLAAVAFIRLSSAPLSWTANVFASVACWLATYSSSNGVLSFPVCLLLVQWSSPSPLRPSSRTVFWVASAILAAVSYLNGFHHEGVAPSLPNMAVFAVAYLGGPLGYLLRFALTGPLSMAFHIGIGAALLAIVATAVARGAVNPRSREGDRIAISFGAFAIGGALLTAYGRAGELHNAGTPHYVLFSSFLLLALIFWSATRLPAPLSSERGERRALGAYLIFLVAAATSYADAIPIYRYHHERNRLFATAFNSSPELSYADKYLYPDLKRLRELKRLLAEHRLGPYRYTVVAPVAAPSPPPPGSAIVRPDDGASQGRIEVAQPYESSGRRYLDVAGWADTSRNVASRPFVLIEVDRKLREVVPVGLPVTGALPFKLPRPDMDPESGWGILWDIQLPTGLHTIRAFAFDRGGDTLYALGPPRTISWGDP
jgi:hypothetical protein